jgi:hypothetical protein
MTEKPASSLLARAHARPIAERDIGMVFRGEICGVAKYLSNPKVGNFV